ncbi:UDP-glucuronosyltransferase 2B1 [Stylophora pistillata]|uniref:UDP-glucuronosyltransferase n=2 Tax=Stylophora pistillata TaxID=50429 RepID=A0A2B4SK33_STYPI|nr:UDP-glucuronosyltransferase 2B1 [Stylophora pistillata]
MEVVCESLLNDTELLYEIKDFDLIVYESFAPCAPLVAELFDIPEVVINSNPPSNLDNSLYMVPFPVSYVPSRLLPFSCEMSFPQRVINFCMVNIFQFVLETLSVRSYSSLKEKYNITPDVSFREAVASAELVLFNGDFAIECPQPLLPGQIMLGPIAAESKPNPLPPDLADFINSSGAHGFIIASFGSYAQTIISKRTIDVLAAAFGKLKQKVIWKLKGYIPSSLSPNIKVMKWIPQNDLLAHKDIKAFVSHTGINSFYESAYHGVPVVAIPLFMDQFSNARKAEYFGIATVLDHQTMSAKELFEAIQLVMNEPRFKETSMRISRLMKDSPRTPLEKAGDWIEYVHRHGGAQHLRAQVFNIPWYQYYLLDVIAFLVAIVMLVVMVMSLACRCLCRVCCKRSANKNKED